MEKKFMNKLDDMELDMVAGGGLCDTLKEAIKQGCYFHAYHPAPPTALF